MVFTEEVRVAIKFLHQNDGYSVVRGDTRIQWRRQGEGGKLPPYG